MAGTVINLTNGIVRLATTSIGVFGVGKPYAKDSIDVLDARQVDLVVHVVGVEGTTPNVTIDFWTSMSNTQDDLSAGAGWSQISAASVSTGSIGVTVKTISSGLLRYLRWNASALTGTTPAVSVQISGVART